MIHRELAESIFAKYLLGEPVEDDLLKESMLVAIEDMHKMTEIEAIVKKERVRWE